MYVYICIYIYIYMFMYMYMYIYVYAYVILFDTCLTPLLTLLDTVLILFDTCSIHTYIYICETSRCSDFLNLV